MSPLPILKPPPSPPEIVAGPVQNVIGWKAFYTDGTIYSSAQTQWALIPVTGIQVLVIYYGDVSPGGHPQRRIASGAELYFIADGPTPADPIFGQTYGTATEAGILAVYPTAIIKIGQWTGEAAYAAILQRAMNETEFP